MLKKVVWFTGLSGVGKSTISNEIFKKLKRKKYKVFKIDGDNFRRKKKYKKLKLFKLSSLEIEKIKINFDLIICGSFLYLLDRHLIFKQFDLISKKLNKNGYLIIQDFDPLFKHTNNNMHNKNFKTFKMSYDNFLEESGLFKMIYKKRNNSKLIKTNDKKKFKSDDWCLTLFKKIDFEESYPTNV